MNDQPLPLLQQRFHPLDEVMATPVDDELVMLDIAKDRYLSLNNTGARVWQLLSEGMSGEQIIDTMAGELAVGRSQLAQDVTELLETLMAKGLVQEISGKR